MDETVRLNTGAEMPAIGFGTWKLDDGAAAYDAVQAALETGYRLIDTAAIYMNESSVGRAIRESDVRREDVFLTTKLWNADLGYERAFSAYENSLDRLGLEYADLYLIHWPASQARLDAWRAMEEMYREGLVRNIGVSNFTIRHLEEMRQAAHLVPSVNQIEFHPLIYNDQNQLLEYCRERGIVVEAYSPLAQGAVLDQTALKRLADSYDKSVPQIVIRWCVQHGTVPIPKSGQPDRMRENLDVFDFELSAKDMARIDCLSEGMRVLPDPAAMA